MTPELTLTHEFIELAPDELKERTLYVSVKYRSVVHLCCCGCGRKVVTPLSPADWKLTFDGVSISLHPSIGNWTFPCKSHYWIHRNKVMWARLWSQAQIEAGRVAEARARAEYYSEELPKTEPQSRPPAPTPNVAKPADALPHKGFWVRYWRRLFGS